MKLSSIFGAKARGFVLAVAMAATTMPAVAQEQDMSIAELIATEQLRINEATAAGNAEQAKELFWDLRGKLAVRLGAAIRVGALAEVQEILGAGIFNDLSQAKTRALEVAVQADQEGVATMLMEDGVKPEAYMGRQAAEKGHRRIMSLMMDYGLSVNAYDGGMAQAAAEAGHGDIVADMLDPVRGADLRTKCEMLIGAVRGGHIDLVDTLLDAGAHINVFSGQPLAMAIRNLDEAMFDHLMARGADANGVYYGRDDETGEPLYAAVDQGSVYFVRKLIAAGADVSKAGGYVLATAVDGKSREMVELLLAEKIDVNAEEGAALARAIRNMDEVMAMRLLDAGANPWLPGVISEITSDSRRSSWAYPSADDERRLEIVERIGREMARRMQQAPQVQVPAMPAPQP